MRVVSDLVIGILDAPPKNPTPADFQALESLLEELPEDSRSHHEIADALLARIEPWHSPIAGPVNRILAHWNFDLARRTFLEQKAWEIAYTEGMEVARQIPDVLGASLSLRVCSLLWCRFLLDPDPWFGLEDVRLSTEILSVPVLPPAVGALVRARTRHGLHRLAPSHREAVERAATERYGLARLTLEEARALTTNVPNLEILYFGSLLFDRLEPESGCVDLFELWFDYSIQTTDEFGAVLGTTGRFSDAGSESLLDFLKLVADLAKLPRIKVN